MTGRCSTPRTTGSCARRCSTRSASGARAPCSRTRTCPSRPRPRTTTTTTTTLPPTTTLNHRRPPSRRPPRPNRRPPRPNRRRLPPSRRPPPPNRRRLPPSRPPPPPRPPRRCHRSAIGDVDWRNTSYLVTCGSGGPASVQLVGGRADGAASLLFAGAVTVPGRPDVVLTHLRCLAGDPATTAATSQFILMRVDAEGATTALAEVGTPATDDVTLGDDGSITIGAPATDGSYQVVVIRWDGESIVVDGPCPARGHRRRAMRASSIPRQDCRRRPRRTGSRRRPTRPRPRAWPPRSVTTPATARPLPPCSWR